MPNYTLYYFNGRGRAEIIRMLFNAAGQKFLDKRIEFNEWDKCKIDFPCNQLPCLEIDGGLKVPETMAIARFLAREYGFYPTTNMEMLRCDYITECFYEILHDYMRYFHSKNGRFRVGSDGMMIGSDIGHSDMSNSNPDNYLQGRYLHTLNRIMPFMERTLSMRDGGSKFFMGNELMLCDMMMYCCLENPLLENQSMLSQYPKLMSLYQRVAQHPKICQYLKIRPNNNF